jgi:predicted ATPase/DNA-binding SARP family transcriptional activator
MDFRLLGRLGVEADGRDLTPTRPRERAVLAAMLLARGRVIGVEELISAVWGDNPPPTVRTALQGHVSALRRRLGTGRIETKPQGYRLRLLPGDALDIDRLEALVSDAGAERAPARAEMLREALALVRGEALQDVDFASDLAGELELDLASERARLEELRLLAEERLAAADLELGRDSEVVPRLERLVAEHPLREALRAQLMLALYRVERQADALRVAQDARRILAAELGVEPGPALQRLELQILNHDPDLSAGGNVRNEGGSVIGESETRARLPSGMVTFLALRQVDEREPLAEAVTIDVAGHGGHPLTTSFGALVFAFRRAREAAAAAAGIQRAARRRGGRPGIGLHSAAAVPVGATYLGADLDRAVRLAAVANPGQVVISRAARDLLREAPLEEADVRELGEHRLADLLPGEPLYQLVAPGLTADFAALRGLEARRTNLPTQPTLLLGREREIGEIVALLRDPGTRLVTLTGPGGIGKTRLACHAGAELLDDAPGGVYFVALDALGQAELVGPAIATALGAREAVGESPATTLARELRGRTTLLVLDNFEHLLAAAPVVGDILASAPGVKVLATSRTPLKLAGELVIPVPSLDAPELGRHVGDVADLLGLGSVALFIARARAARPGFALSPENAPAVASLCRALEGLPLAIELAASRVAVMPPGALLDRLDRPLRVLAAARRPGPARHRALQVTSDWSHDLLEPDARRLFADVSVFAGGWTLAAAEGVCEDGLEVIDGLANLVDQSLVRLGGTDADPRFGMLETIRQHAAAKLTASGAWHNLERRHASFFLSLADAAEPHLRGNPGHWVARLEVEHDNLRAALDRLAELGEPETQARLAGALWRFWYLAGHLSEGRRRLEQALAAYPATTAARAKVLIGAAVMTVNSEDPSAAKHLATEGLALHRSLGDAWGAAYCQFMLGAVARAEDQGDQARALHEEALAAFRVLGDEHTAMIVSRNLAGTVEDLGDREAARAIYQDNLRRARADHDGRLEASSLGALATIAFDDGRVNDALWMLRESLLLHRELGDRLDTAVDLSRAARTLAMAGRAADAARLSAALSTLSGELGPRRRAVAARTDETVESIRRQLSAAEFSRAWDEGSEFDIDAAVGAALDALV